MYGRVMPAKVLTLYNHKGGVGKSTITVNLARGFGQNGIRTLVVDGDPQCSVSAFYHYEEDLDAMLASSSQNDGNTIWSGISKARRGRGDVRGLQPGEFDNNVWLLTGDEALAPFEDKLSEAWKGCFGRDAQAIDLMSALYRAIQATADNIRADLVMLDLGPNIGPLNRSLILGSDYIAVPVACDLFSLRAFGTLGKTLASWMKDWSTIRDLAADLKEEDLLLLKGRPVCIGYITQHFNIYRSRATIPFEEWERKIPPRFKRDVVDPLREIDVGLVPDFKSNKIGSVKSFHGLVPQSQKLGIALGGLRGQVGVNSGYNPKIQEADTLFREMATQMAARMGVSR